MSYCITGLGAQVECSLWSRKWHAFSYSSAPQGSVIGFMTTSRPFVLLWTGQGIMVSRRAFCTSSWQPGLDKLGPS